MNKILNFNSPVTFNISRIINEKGLKQYVVAENADLTAQALCDAMCGRRILKISEVNAIAKALGVDVSELFKPCDSD